MSFKNSINKILHSLLTSPSSSFPFCLSNSQWLPSYDLLDIRLTLTSRTIFLLSITKFVSSLFPATPLLRALQRRFHPFGQRLGTGGQSVSVLKPSWSSSPSLIVFVTYARLTQLTISKVLQWSSAGGLWKKVLLVSNVTVISRLLFFAYLSPLWTPYDVALVIKSLMILSGCLPPPRCSPTSRLQSCLLIVMIEALSH